MEKSDLFLSQIKENVLKHLKEINLTKKDRDFLLELIKLFDLLSNNTDGTFINSLIKLINNAQLKDKEELNARLSSLNVQLEEYKFIQIKHLPYFSMYFEKEKISIYIKKISSNWDLLISEIDQIDFSRIRVIVYKSTLKKEKLLNKSLKKEKLWKIELINIIENNICINIRIILDLQKEVLN